MKRNCAYGLQIHSNINNIVMFAGFFCKAGTKPYIEK